VTAPPQPRLRAPGTRLGRRNSGPQRLESVAAEFAMLAQRRARLMRQIDLLDRQRRAADDSFAILDRRMVQLSRMMAVADAAAPAAPPAAPASPLPVTLVPTPFLADDAPPAPRKPATARGRGTVLEY
jgi:hypothetical protein